MSRQESGSKATNQLNSQNEIVDRKGGETIDPRGPIVRCPICHHEMKDGVEEFDTIVEGWNTTDVIRAITYSHAHKEEGITVTIRVERGA